MAITGLILKNFRCFPALELEFNESIIIIEGSNGAGKTSILEALHYACHLRSFRTHQVRDLILQDQAAFFIKVRTINDELSLGYSLDKRSIKINGAPVKEYKTITNTYRVVTLIEDDLLLIKGNPEARRSFLDSALILLEPSYALLMRNYRKVLDQRNALFGQLGFVGLTKDHEIWGDRLQELGGIIRNHRQSFLKKLQYEVIVLSRVFFKGGEVIGLKYQTKDTPEATRPLLEGRMGRTLFGPHLDDFEIILLQKNSKAFASRGQQKLLVTLCKIAIAQMLGETTVFLLDDFIADFDEDRIELIIGLLQSTKAQIVFTVPHNHGALHTKLALHAHQRILLTR